MIRIAIVEDDDTSAALLGGFVRRYAAEKKKELAVTRFASGVDFISDYAPVYDIVLMDIEMPFMDGMTTARKLRELGDKSPVIFITNMAQYAVKGYEVDALDFMVKPVSYYNFSVKLGKAVAVVLASRDDVITLTLKDGMKKLYVDDVKYIEVFRHDLIYHTTDEKFATRGALREAEEKLSGKGFARCNSCWLVNMKFVTEVKNNLVVVGGESLTISRTKKKDFMNALTLYYAGGVR